MAVIAMICVAFCAYVVADALDAVPGWITLAPANYAQPYPELDPARYDGDEAARKVIAHGLSPAAAPLPEAAQVQHVLESLANDERVAGTVSAVVWDAQSGAELGALNATQPLAPASNMKVITAYAALKALGPENTFATKAVLSGTTVYLVGGGDILLAADAGDAQTTIGHAGLGDLARAAAKQLAAKGISQVTVQVDTSAYAGPAYEPSVDAGGREYVMPLAPLAVDRGRAGGSYQADPQLRANQAFIAQLQAAGVDAQPAGAGQAPRDVQELARVESAPVRDFADLMLLVSDNSIAEDLAHQVAIARGQQADFSGGAKAVTEVLHEAGFDMNGVVIADGSGLSHRNRVPAALFAQILRDVWACELPEAADSGDLTGDSRASAADDKAAKADAAGKTVDKKAGKAAGEAATEKAAGSATGKTEKAGANACLATQIGMGMPLAGVDGSLRQRLAAGDAAGRVHAKTGSLAIASSLSGYLYTAKGRPLIFSIIINSADRTPRPDAYEFRPAIDEAVSALVAL